MRQARSNREELASCLHALVRGDDTEDAAAGARVLVERLEDIWRCAVLTSSAHSRRKVPLAGDADHSVPVDEVLLGDDSDLMPEEDDEESGSTFEIDSDEE